MNGRWWDRAACLGTSPEIFFKDKKHGWNHEREAKAICATCPVRKECYLDGVDDDFSIRAGLTATERARMRKQAAA